MQGVLATQEQALSVKCPVCKSEPGEVCVYVAPANEGLGRRSNSKAVRDRTAMVGKPTQIPHSRRHREFTLAKVRHERLLAYNRMVRFMRNYGYIFQEEP